MAILDFFYLGLHMGRTSCSVFHFGFFSGWRFPSISFEGFTSLVCRFQLPYWILFMFRLSKAINISSSFTGHFIILCTLTFHIFSVVNSHPFWLLYQLLQVGVFLPDIISLSILSFQRSTWPFLTSFFPPLHISRTSCLIVHLHSSLAPPPSLAASTSKLNTLHPSETSLLPFSFFVRFILHWLWTAHLSSSD